MNFVGRRIYFDKFTGEVITITGQREGTDVRQRTVEEDYQAFVSLSERNPETVGILELEYGAYDADFEEQGIITKVDLETLEPLFSYPDPTDPETPQEPQPALSEQLATLKTENETLKNRVSDVEMTITEILFS